MKPRNMHHSKDIIINLVNGMSKVIKSLIKNIKLKNSVKKKKKVIF